MIPTLLIHGYHVPGGRRSRRACSSRSVNDSCVLAGIGRGRYRGPRVSLHRIRDLTAYKRTASCTGEPLSLSLYPQRRGARLLRAQREHHCSIHYNLYRATLIRPARGHLHTSRSPTTTGGDDGARPLRVCLATRWKGPSRDSTDACERPGVGRALRDSCAQGLLTNFPASGALRRTLTRHLP